MRTYVITILSVFMYSGLMLEGIVMDLFSDITKKTDSAKKEFFPKSRVIEFTYTKDIRRIIYGKTNF